MKKATLSRRTILRGLGVSMPLPWLESVRAFGDDTKDAAKLNEPPTRMAIHFSGCVLVGGGGGKLKGGQNLDYLGKTDRQMCRLYLSMMDKMGVQIDTFGDAREPLLEV